MKKEKGPRAVRVKRIELEVPPFEVRLNLRGHTGDEILEVLGWLSKDFMPCSGGFNPLPNSGSVPMIKFVTRTRMTRHKLSLLEELLERHKRRDEEE